MLRFLLRHDVLTLVFMNIISVLCVCIEHLKEIHSMYQEMVRY
jgi:hypothetical protein